MAPNWQPLAAMQPPRQVTPPASGAKGIVARTDATYKTVIKDFYHRFGDVMKLIEPLADFHLFRIKPQRGRFIRGFGQAYELAGDRLEQLIPVVPGKK